MYIYFIPFFLFPINNILVDNISYAQVETLTWSWWSKKVLTHTLELVSHTFTLLSDELNTTRERFHYNIPQCINAIYLFTLTNRKPVKEWSLTWRRSERGRGRRRRWGPRRRGHWACPPARRVVCRGKKTIIIYCHEAEQENNSLQILKGPPMPG